MAIGRMPTAMTGSILFDVALRHAGTTSPCVIRPPCPLAGAPPPGTMHVPETASVRRSHAAPSALHRKHDRNAPTKRANIVRQCLLKLSLVIAFG
ncbi:hypothetical protein [Sphingomonas montana]|uniref:hypothetical protein n=1 Tax=Sphingomonas montana TaxID=1843236 RepID=UPI00101AD20E|nr:hypothetical protein [Sphingomonas montana]